MDTFSQLKSRPAVALKQQARGKAKLPIFFSEYIPPMEQIKLALRNPVYF